jgi:sugar fermentation stimulation protein
MSKNSKNFLTGKFIKRYKKFFVDVQLDSKKIVTAHCPNTGSIMGRLEKDNLVYLTEANDPNRKLKFTLEAIQSNGARVGENTHRANRMVEEAISKGKISELGKIVSFKREVKYGQNSRIDFLAQTKKEEIYVEVKKVTLSREKSMAEFPDAVTERGLKHLNELSTLPTKSVRAVRLFLVQREECSKFKKAAEIDTKYAETFKKGKKKGVEPLCYDGSFGRKGKRVNKKIKK